MAGEHGTAVGWDNHRQIDSSWLFPSWREEAGPGGVNIGLQLHQGQVSPSSSSSGSSADQAASTGS